MENIFINVAENSDAFAFSVYRIMFFCFGCVGTDAAEPIKTILLVEEDEPQACVFILKCKTATRCSIVHETDAKKALGRFARGEKYDLVISDVCMAGMDGIAFLRAMFSNGFNEQAKANIATTAAPVLSRHPSDVTIHRNLSELVKDFNVLVHDKSHGDIINLPRVVKTLLESDSFSVEDARMVMTSTPWDGRIANDTNGVSVRSDLSESSIRSADLSESSIRSGRRSEASSIGDKLVSSCLVDGVRVRSFYARAFRERNFSKKK